MDGDGDFRFRDGEKKKFLTVREMAKKKFFSRDRGIGVFWIPFTRNA